MDWISVCDRLPDDEQIVLVFSPNLNDQVWLGYLAVHEDETWYLVDGGDPGVVTHWMALPAGPD
jgi:hypothetical protein